MENDGLIVYSREYEKQLVLTVGNEAGFAVEFQGAALKKMADLLAARGIRLVKESNAATAIRVDRVIDGKEAGDLLAIGKG